MSEPLDVDAIERAVRCPCGESGCSAEAREPTVLALVAEVRRLRAGSLWLDKLTGYTAARFCLSVEWREDAWRALVMVDGRAQSYSAAETKGHAVVMALAAALGDALGEADAARRERDEALKDRLEVLECHTKDVHLMKDALDALDEYGWHRPSCGHGIKRSDGTVNPCDCGWQQRRDQIDGAS